MSNNSLISLFFGNGFFSPRFRTYGAPLHYILTCQQMQLMFFTGFKCHSVGGSPDIFCIIHLERNTKITSSNGLWNHNGRIVEDCMGGCVLCRRESCSFWSNGCCLGTINLNTYRLAEKSTLLLIMVPFTLTSVTNPFVTVLLFVLNWSLNSIMRFS